MEDPTQEIYSKFVKYLEACEQHGVISIEQLNKLKAPQNIDTQIIYFLPKIHKDPLKIRPIVSCTNGPTETASAFLDKILQLYMKKVKSYISNSADLIRILETLIVPDPDLLDYT